MTRNCLEDWVHFRAVGRAKIYTLSYRDINQSANAMSKKSWGYHKLPYHIDREGFVTLYPNYLYIKE